ncbi:MULTISPECIES: acylphosphatase [unclassified Methylophaga]|jgi:acylphosphatase|uniref:acylphosphatase n=1 Tax=unclassified Methylophaga TaxID=2629249 RepID=UPI000C65E7D6|nr:MULTISPECIES: acylphosphatase [unclassified Methylophaga]MAL50863.1 acylphosphatase [Methylophaga sp.]MBP25833.1 acylphosphatase [Methylophaga sp.]HCC80092.1 acylphosphatase [Methylophaga sp.]|tara:strand:- start:5017 stop:5292 length:276 start_codon:yes stop_codon:yes gene_type:complete
MGIKRYHFVIEGRVQGVSYRMSAQIAAQKIGVTGWVRNLRSGQVEMVAEGEPAQLEQLLEWAWQGPNFAQVTDISLEKLTATGEFSLFEIR